MIAAWDKVIWRNETIGVYGFDLLPDTNHKLWLLEVNKCPAMDYSTHVTADLVPRFMEDLAKIVIDKDPNNTGGFELIYESPFVRDTTFDNQVPELVVQGQKINK